MTRVEEGRRLIEIKGVARYQQDFWKYQLSFIDPQGTAHDLQEFSSSVESDGHLATIHFESLTQTYGEGWYIINLKVILNGGNRPWVGFEQTGCYVRVYLPPYR